MLFDKPVAPKRFYNMIQEFKESDLDYVVFDLSLKQRRAIEMPRLHAALSENRCVRDIQ